MNLKEGKGLLVVGIVCSFLGILFYLAGWLYEFNFAFGAAIMALAILQVYGINKEKEASA